MVLAGRRRGQPRRGQGRHQRAILDYPNVDIAGRAELRRRAAAAIDPALRLFYSLLGLAMPIALFGIVNTLALSVLERAASSACCHRRDLTNRAMIRWEDIIAPSAPPSASASAPFIGWAVSRDLDLPATPPRRPAHWPPRPRSPPASSPRPCPPAEPPRSTCSAPSPRSD